MNVGMTDLVTSLCWIRVNIANFGGDPDKVMIYGQSGGGIQGHLPNGDAFGWRANPSGWGAVGRRGKYPERGTVEGAGTSSDEKSSGLRRAILNH